MFHFNPDQQPSGDRLSQRIMTAEYNLAVQRRDYPQAQQAQFNLIGWFLERMGWR